MKKLFAFLLFSIATAASYAQETVTISDVKYLLDEGEATILVQSSDLSGDIVVPSTLTHNGVDYTVNRMMDEAFKSTKITSIVLPNTLTKIGEHTLQYCYELKSVTLPEGMTNLSEGMFYSDNNLITITIPKGVTSIGEYCFSGCRSLPSITLPDNIESIGGYAFSECGSLTEIELPNSITSLGDYCFINSGLTSIMLPNSIKEMGNSCFCNCSKLLSVTLPSSLSTLPASCFSNCSKLQSITIPNNYTTIENGCFSQCSNLSSVTLSNNIENLEDWSFAYCFSLSSIKLPKTIKKIGIHAFSSCPLVAITLPSSITSIGSRGFGNCTSLIKVTCQWDDLNNVEVNNDAFDNIYSKAELYVPNGTIETYKAQTPWSNFAYIYEKGGTGTPTEKCATPVIGYADGKLTFSSSTAGAQYHYAITDDDILANGYSETGSVILSATYNIRAYAVADGYQKSDVAEAKLCFINANIESSISSPAKQRGVLVEANGQNVSVSGLTDGETVQLYNTAGILLSTTRAAAGTANLSAQGAQGIVIVKIGNDSLKINIK